MVIRQATEQDLPAVMALYAQLGQSGEAALSAEEAAAIFEKIEAYPSYHIYLALLGGEAVGTFSLTILDNLTHAGAAIGAIEATVVDERHRGAGIGRAMMQHAMELCRGSGCYKVIVSSNQNREAAHRFYESLGFERHGYSFLVELGD